MIRRATEAATDRKRFLHFDSNKSKPTQHTVEPSVVRTRNLSANTGSSFGASTLDYWRGCQKLVKTKKEWKKKRKGNLINFDFNPMSR
jgi:hypothetical protein